MTNLIETITAGIIGLWLGSVEYRMRKVRERSEESPKREEVSKLIDLKQEALKVSHIDIKKDLEKLERKIDKLIDIQLNSK